MTRAPLLSGRVLSSFAHGAKRGVVLRSEIFYLVHSDFHVRNDGRGGYRYLGFFEYNRAIFFCLLYGLIITIINEAKNRASSFFSSGYLFQVT